MADEKLQKRMIGFRAPSTFGEALKAKARSERRTMASYMKKVLSDSIGYGGDL